MFARSAGAASTTSGGSRLTAGAPISAAGAFLGGRIWAVGSVAVIVFVSVAVVLVERLLLVEDAAFLGALPLQEFVVDGPFLPCHLLLRP